MSLPEMFNGLPEYRPYTSEELAEMLSGQPPFDPDAQEPDIYMTSQIVGDNNGNS